MNGSVVCFRRLTHPPKSLSKNLNLMSEKNLSSSSVNKSVRASEDGDGEEDTVGCCGLFFDFFLVLLPTQVTFMPASVQRLNLQALHLSTCPHLPPSCAQRYSLWRPERAQRWKKVRQLVHTWTKENNVYFVEGA